MPVVFDPILGPIELAEVRQVRKKPRAFQAIYGGNCWTCGEYIPIGEWSRIYEGALVHADVCYDAAVGL